MQQDRLAIERFPAEPKRCDEITPLRCQQSDLPARFVALPAAEIAQAQPRQAFGKSRRRKIGLADERTAGAHDRFARTVEPAQRNSAIGQKLKIVRRGFECRVICSERVLDTIELEERIAAIAEGFKVIGLDSEDAIEV